MFRSTTIYPFVLKIWSCSYLNYRMNKVLTRKRVGKLPTSLRLEYDGSLKHKLILKCNLQKDKCIWTLLSLIRTILFARFEFKTLHKNPLNEKYHTTRLKTFLGTITTIFCNDIVLNEEAVSKKCRLQTKWIWNTNSLNAFNF